MKLCIRQKVFSWLDHFTVTDENGRSLYQVKGELALGKRLRVLDMSGRELALIEQKIISFLPRYVITPAGGSPFTVVKKFTLFRPSYAIEGTNWSVEGEIWEHSYRIFCGGRAVASVEKEWFTFGDCYALDIDDPALELTALTITLVIDCAMAAAGND